MTNPLASRFFRVSHADRGKTAERFLLDLGATPRSAIKRAFLNGEITSDGRPLSRATNVAQDSVIEVKARNVFFRDELLPRPNNDIPIDEVFTNASVVVVNKPAGQNAHPLRPDETNTTLNGLVARYPECGHSFSPDRPLEGGLLHRLDRGTSGLLACARDPEAFCQFKSAWRARAVTKHYLAWARGAQLAPGTYDLALSHDTKSRRRMRVTQRSSESKIKTWQASTSIYPLAPVSPTSTPQPLLICIHTGVTHQIRVTLAALGAAIIEDYVYASTKPILPPPRPAPLSPALLEMFENWASRLSLRSATKIAIPPQNAFFLHALALTFRGVGIAKLPSTLVAPIPEYFAIDLRRPPKCPA